MCYAVIFSALRLSVGPVESIEPVIYVTETVLKGFVATFKGPSC